MLELPDGAAQLRLWSAEQPHLYLLLLTLVEGGGGGTASAAALEIEACQVGRSSLNGEVAVLLLYVQYFVSRARLDIRQCVQGCLSTSCANLTALHRTAPLQVGFRHAEIKGRQLLHNGQPVMLKGALLLFGLQQLEADALLAALRGLVEPSTVERACCTTERRLLSAAPAAGVNRHEHDQLRGKTVSLEGMVQVGGAMKLPRR